MCYWILLLSETCPWFVLFTVFFFKFDNKAVLSSFFQDSFIYLRESVHTPVSGGRGRAKGGTSGGLCADLRARRGLHLLPWDHSLHGNQMSDA